MKAIQAAIWPVASPEGVAQFPNCTQVSSKAMMAAIFHHIAKYLEFETKQGYRADRELALPPLPEELRENCTSEWDSVVDWYNESGWDIELDDNWTIRLKPKAE
jgi:hypothetical protein